MGQGRSVSLEGEGGQAWTRCGDTPVLAGAAERGGAGGQALARQHSIVLWFYRMLWCQVGLGPNLGSAIYDLDALAWKH